MKNARFYDAGNNKQGLGLDRVVSTNSKEGKRLSNPMGG